MLSRIISAIYDEAFAPIGLKISQFTILRVLRGRGPTTAAELCKLVLMDKSTASRNLQQMRRRSWIKLVTTGEGRGLTLAITLEGSKILKKAHPLWRSAQDEAMRRLGAEGDQALNLVLTNMRE
jgi:DNA-binding MarR family transcriptional regulator